MKFIDNILKKLNIKKTKRRNNVLFNTKKTKYKSKRIKKFNIFKTKFNFNDISLSDYYNKNNNHIYYFIISFILISLSIYAFLFSDYFNVKKILIVEKKIINKNIIDNDYAGRKLNDFMYKSIFFTDKQRIKNILKKYQNSIKKVEVKRLFPSTLKVVVYPYKPVFRTNFKNKNYIILKNGAFVPSSYKKNLLEISVFDKKLEEKRNIEYKKIFEPKNILYIQYLYNNIVKNLANLKIISVRYFPMEREVHFVLQNNIILIFSLDSKIKNLKEQLEKMLIFKENKQKDFLNNFYIDLRIPKKVFFCPKKNIVQCKTNYKYFYNLEDKDLIIKKKEDNKKKEKKNKK